MATFCFSIFSTIPSSSSLSINNIRIPSSSSPFIVNTRTRTAGVRCSVKMHSSIRSDLDAPIMFPLQRCKTLHMVRHAQGFHNVAGEKDESAYLSEELFDAELTPLGWRQVDNLHKHVQESGIAKKIDLVVVSPLLRTMQTAVGVFGGERYIDGTDLPPLMVGNIGNSNRSAVSSSNCPPFIAVEGCREHLGVHPCVKRRSITEYRPLFPAIDFSHVVTDEDVLWRDDIREVDEEIVARGINFFNWLWTRKEKEIAIVSHTGFLLHTLKAIAKGLNPSVKNEICKNFANCELRSVVMVDRSIVGTDASTTN